MPNSDSPVFTATDYLAYLRTNGQVPDMPPPKSVILCYQNDVLKYLSRKYSLRKIRVFGSELSLLKKSENQIGVFGGFGVGSPATGTIVDLFCAFGVQQFFIIGFAGGLQLNLQTGNLVLSSGAIRGEGVSRRYLSEEEIVQSKTSLIDGFSQYLTENRYEHSVGVTWTTDTPFREMQSQVAEYQSKGILAVDMEAAAMLSVAEANGRSGFAAFSISDSVANGTWSISNDLTPAKKGLFTLLDCLVNFLLR